MSRKIIIGGQRKNKLTKQREQIQDSSFDYMNQDHSCISFLIDDDVQDNKRILDDLNVIDDDETKKQCIFKPIYDEYRQKMDIKFEQNQPDTIERFKENMLQYDTTDISVYDEDFRLCDEYDNEDQEYYFTKKTTKITAF